MGMAPEASHQREHAGRLLACALALAAPCAALRRAAWAPPAARRRRGVRAGALRAAARGARARRRRDPAGRAEASAAARRSRSSGRRIVVRGIVTPYVAGQTVKVSFYRDGAQGGRRTSSACCPTGNGAGQFHVGFTSHYARAACRRARRTTPRAQQAARSAAARPRCSSSTRTSARAPAGQSVRLLQSELDVLHYAVPLTGVFDEGTGRALIAYPQDDRPRTGARTRAGRCSSGWRAARAASTCATAATAATSRPTSPNRCWPRSNRAGACTGSTR